MTVEELMKPRYKVIADYIHSPYQIGDLVDMQIYPKTECSCLLTQTNYRDEFGDTLKQNNYFPESKINVLPHLFKKLEWWEEREEKEMLHG